MNLLTLFFQHKYLVEIIICISLFNLSCTQKKHKLSFPQLKAQKLHEYTVISPEDYTMGQLRFEFEINNTGSRLAFYDQTMNKMLVTDSLGNVIHILGRAGRGPGEFEKVISFVFDENDFLVIYDDSQKMVKIFDDTGKFYHSFEVQNAGELSIVGTTIEAWKGRIYFGAIETQYLPKTPNIGTSKSIAEFDYRGTFLGGFGQYDSLSRLSKDYYMYSEVTLDKARNRLYTNRSNGYVSEGWNLDTKERVDVIAQEPFNFSEPEKYISAYQPISEIRKQYIENTVGTSLYIGSHHNYLILSNSTEEWANTTTRDHYAKDHYVIMYDKQGVLLGETSIESLPGTVSRNQLHLIENDDPDNYTIGVYEFSLD